jgi:hypothetical protein
VEANECYHDVLFLGIIIDAMMVTGQLKACDDELSSEDCVGSDPSVAVCR